MSNYILRGKLDILGDLIINETVSDIRSESALTKKLSSDNFKDVMEITDNKRSIDNLTVDNLLLISFDCKDQSELCVNGSTTTMNSEILE
jgi:hypothetical protein